MKLQKSTYQLEVISRIRNLRIKNNVSQIKLADLLDVSSGHIGNVESPKFQHKYTLKQLWIITNYFGTSMEYILTGKSIVLTSDQLIKYLIDYD